MRDRALSDAAASEAATRSYIQEAAGAPSAADEIAKLASLRDQGVLTDAEFATQKAALLG
jgi:hypothetical protein